MKKNIACDLAITLKCNGHCRCCSYLCDINMPDSSTMTLDDVENAMNHIDEFNAENDEFNVYQIRILGGEPTLHKDLLQMISQVQKHGKQAAVMSNMSADPETYDRIRSMNSQVWFSGSIQQKHNNHYMFPADYAKMGYEMSFHGMINQSCCDTFCIRKIQGALKYFYCPCQASIGIALDRLDETASDNLFDAISMEKREVMIREMCPMCWFAYKGQNLPLAKDYDMQVHCPQILDGIEKFKLVK